MKLRTEINSNFLMRMGLVGLFCVGMAIYCAYEGAVNYPNQRERGLAYQAFEEANPTVGEKDLYDLWAIEAEKKGWPQGVAGKEHSPYGEVWPEYKINQQYYMGAFIGLVGLFFVGRFLLNRGSWIEADDQGLVSSEKREVHFDQIATLDKKKWDSKGIAYVRYETDGKKNCIVLDDCNYNRETTVAILRHVESKISVGKIANGKPEPPPKPKNTPNSDTTPNPAPGEPASAGG